VSPTSRISRAGQPDLTFCLHYNCQKAVVPSFNIRDLPTGTHEASSRFTSSLQGP
jgi:hypothetical protein